MNIYFYNHFHLGDLHLSRSIVKLIKNYAINQGHNCFYSHKNNPNCLKDLSLPVVDKLQQFPTTPILTKGDDVGISTWYGSGFPGTSGFDNMNKYGLTFDCLYNNLEYATKELFGIQLADLSQNLVDFFPEPDYNHFTISSIDSWASNTSNQKVYIFNGTALSGQSTNFSFASAINTLAKSNPYVMFVISNKDATIIKRDNIKFADDIIGFDSFNLNENAYLSTKCNLIVGRASGAFTFAFNKTNLFDIGQTFICASNLSYKNKFWLGEMFESRINYKSKIINQDIKDSNTLIRMVQENIP